MNGFLLSLAGLIISMGIVKIVIASAMMLIRRKKEN